MAIFDLEERMIRFSVKVIRYSENLPKTNIGLYYSDQIMRSASSAILNYSEAISAESRKDFIHKMKISLKELRETFSAIRILKQIREDQSETMNWMINENNELISIMVQSIKTARKNMNT